MDGNGRKRRRSSTASSLSQSDHKHHHTLDRVSRAHFAGPRRRPDVDLVAIAKIFDPVRDCGEIAHGDELLLAGRVQGAQLKEA